MCGATLQLPRVLCVCVAQRGVLGGQLSAHCCVAACAQIKTKKKKTCVEGWLSGGMQRYAGVCVPAGAWCVAAAAFPRVASIVMLAAHGAVVGVRRGLVCSSSETPGTVLASQLCGTHHVRLCGSLLGVLVATAYVQCHATQCPVSVPCCLGLLYGPVCHEVGQDPFLGATGSVAWP